MRIESGAVDLSKVDQDIIPDADLTRSVGSKSFSWLNLFVGTIIAVSLVLGSVWITSDGNELIFNNISNVDFNRSNLSNIYTIDAERYYQNGTVLITGGSFNPDEYWNRTYNYNKTETNLSIDQREKYINDTDSWKTNYTNYPNNSKLNLTILNKLLDYSNKIITNNTIETYLDNYYTKLLVNATIDTYLLDYSTKTIINETINQLNNASLYNTNLNNVSSYTAWLVALWPDVTDSSLGTYLKRWNGWFTRGNFSESVIIASTKNLTIGGASKGIPEIITLNNYAGWFLEWQQGSWVATGYLQVGDVVMDGGKGILMHRAGSITGISLHYDCADSLLVTRMDLEVRKNDAVVWFNSISYSDGDNKEEYFTQIRNLDQFVAGDILQVTITIVGTGGEGGQITVDEIISLLEIYYDT